jgi:hypothetical protein
MDGEVAQRDKKAIFHDKHTERARVKCELAQKAEDFLFLFLLACRRCRFTIDRPLLYAVITPQREESRAINLSLMLQKHMRTEGRKKE